MKCSQRLPGPWRRRSRRRTSRLGRIYPALSRIREVSAEIALAVARIAFARGLAAIAEPADLAGHIRSKMYDPIYRTYV